MFILTLKITDKTKARPHMDAHNAWLQRGFEDKVFLLVGSLQQTRLPGGVILAHNLTRAEIEARLKTDPLIANAAATADIQQIAPSRAAPRLAFLM